MSQPDPSFAPAGAPARPGVSLVIPVKDEEESIAPLVEEVVEVDLPQMYDLEVVLIDDGSTDRTPEVIAGLMSNHPFVRCLRLDRCHGKSAAWDAGFRAATREFIATMDADLQNDPRDVPRLVEALQEGYDLVSGRRERRADTLWRKIQSRVANYVRTFVLKDNAIDCGCGIKAFRRACIARITMFRGAHRFMEALFQSHGFRFKQILVKDRKRQFGAAKYTFRKRGVLRPAADMFGVLWLKRRTDKYTARPMPGSPEPK